MPFSTFLRLQGGTIAHAHKSGVIFSYFFKIFQTKKNGASSKDDYKSLKWVLPEKVLTEKIVLDKIKHVGLQRRHRA